MAYFTSCRGYSDLEGADGNSLVKRIGKNGIRAIIFIAILLAALVLFSVLFKTGGTLMIKYINPVVNENAPDPGVLFYKDAYYAVTSSGNASNVFPIRKSLNLVDWGLSGFIFPSDNPPPSWAVSDFIQPELHVFDDKLRLVFAARDGTGRYCLGSAVPVNGVHGRWTGSPAPFLCDDECDVAGPNVLWDEQEDNYYLFYAKYCPYLGALNGETTLLSHEMSPSGLELMNDTLDAVEVLRPDLPWEGTAIAGPWAIWHGEYYYLFYSANDRYHPMVNESKYALGVARSRFAQGPYEKHGDPILHSDDEANSPWVGPGHVSVVLDAGYWVAIYHSRKRGDDLVTRYMLADMLHIDSRGDLWPTFYNQEPSYTERELP